MGAGGIGNSCDTCSSTYLLEIYLVRLCFPGKLDPWEFQLARMHTHTHEAQLSTLGDAFLREFTASSNIGNLFIVHQYIT